MLQLRHHISFKHQRPSDHLPRLLKLSAHWRALYSTARNTDGGFSHFSYCSLLCVIELLWVTLRVVLHQHN